MSEENPALFIPPTIDAPKSSEGDTKDEAKRDYVLEGVLAALLLEEDRQKTRELRGLLNEWREKFSQQIGRPVAWMAYVDTFVNELKDGYGYSQAQLEAVALYHMLIGSTIDERKIDQIQSLDLPNNVIEKFIRENRANIA